MFDHVYARTGNFSEAAFQGLEVINFGRRGYSPAARIAATIIPFLNARIQGTDVLYRSFTGKYHSDRTKGRGSVLMGAWTRGMMLAFATLLYYMAFGDEDEYIEQDDFIREMFWTFPMPGGRPPLRIPIPFEVGFLFKTIPELFYQQWFGGKDGLHKTSGREKRQAITRGLGNTFELSPLQIQQIGPLVEAIANYNSLTGKPIVPPWLAQTEGSQGAMAAPYTNQIAKFLGEKTNTNPLKWEHVMEGYGGTLGVYALNVMDRWLRTETFQDFAVETGLFKDKTPVLPAKRWYEMPVARRIFARESGNGLIRDAYELDREVEGVVDTYLTLQKDGREKEANAYIMSRQHLLALRPTTQGIKRQLDIWRAQKRAVSNDREMDPEHKRRQELLFDRMINATLRDVIPHLKDAAKQNWRQPLYGSGEE